MEEKLCHDDCCPTIGPLSHESAMNLGFYDSTGNADPIQIMGWFVITDDFGKSVILHESHLNFLAKKYPTMPTPHKPIKMV